MSKDLKLYGNDYHDYIELLSLGTVYYILISKRLLLKPMIPLWLYFGGLFLIGGNVFFAMVGLPSLIIFLVFLMMYFPPWQACNISTKAYVVFHSISLLLLKVISVPVSMLLEVLWTLCI